MGILYLVECDQCRAIADYIGGSSPESARARASQPVTGKPRGWVWTVIDGRDYCPECKAKVSREALHRTAKPR